MCSTPFGIIGIHTRRFDSRDRQRCARVLNAFRHHWNSHERARHIRRMGAIVLNAFRHHWNSHTLRRECSSNSTTCSTPFGIIGIHTCLRLGYLARGDRVLNAFRHHWNSHAAAGQVHHPGCVLNAFRHHWNSHKLTRRVLKEMAKVLNAFRHHWNSHRVEAQVKELP